VPPQISIRVDARTFCLELSRPTRRYFREARGPTQATKRAADVQPMMSLPLAAASLDQRSTSRCSFLIIINHVCWSIPLMDCWQLLDGQARVTHSPSLCLSKKHSCAYQQRERATPRAAATADLLDVEPHLQKHHTSVASCCCRCCCCWRCWQPRGVECSRHQQHQQHRATTPTNRGLASMVWQTLERELLLAPSA